MSIWPHPDKAALSQSIAQCTGNGKGLLDDARLLLGFDRFSKAFALSILAQEEFSKAFILQLVSDDALPWIPAIQRSMARHHCKHLLSIVLDWLPQFDLDAYAAQDAVRAERHHAKMAWYERKFERARKGLPLDDHGDPEPTEPEIHFPGDVAAALNIFRFEEIEALRGGSRWKDADWASGRARRVADGSLDRRKQSALYVGITVSGEVGSHPDAITKEEAETAIATAERLSDQPVMRSGEYATLIAALRHVFADLDQNENSS